ncbi:RNA polymerase II associated protein 2 [Borealophlyctis nickersoniae]|nr:RNA polymerase II associated protein 2 [Borealophlyctis nickersoniae]
MNGPHGPSPLGGSARQPGAGKRHAGAPSRQKPPRKKKELTGKQAAIKQSILTRKEWDDRVFEWQQRLFDGAVDPGLLKEAVRYFTPQDYDDVIIERAADKQCGYPLCGKPVTDAKGRYKISLSERKIYDMTESKSYCSSQCMAASKYLVSQLLPEPAYMRNFDLCVPSEWIPVFELIPAGVSIKKVRQASEQPLAANTREQLLNQHVQSLLQNLPVAGNHSLVIREKHAADAGPCTLPTPLAAEADTIEGFKIEFKDPRKATDRSSGPSTMVLSSSNRSQAPQSTPPTMEPMVVEVEQRLSNMHIDPSAPVDEMERQFRRVHFKESASTMPSSHPATHIPHTSSPPQHSHIPSAMATGLSAPHHPNGPASPRQPVIPNPSHRRRASTTRSVTPRPAPTRFAPTDSWLRPRKLKHKPQLSLFGKVWMTLDRMITPQSRLFVQSLGEQDFDARQFMVVDGDAGMVRKSIFSEKMLASLALVRREGEISLALRDDLLGLIGTLQVRENTVVLSAPEEWVICLVFVKVLCSGIPILASEIDHIDKWNSLLARVEMTVEELDVFARQFRA